jgi:hypothetical protein
MTVKGDTDAVNIIVCAELTELIPGNLEMPI